MKIIEHETTFENIIDFSMLFTNPMFYHSTLYTRYIQVAFKNAPKEIKKVIEMKVSVAENSDVKKVYREIIKAIKDFEKLEEL